MSDRVFVGLGSNLGDREEHLRRAAAALDGLAGVERGRESSLYDTAPVGPSQPRYLNAAVELRVALGPEALLSALKALERELGRAASSERWGPRTIDFDLLFWEGVFRSDASLTLPHPELRHRRFALEPLLELAPALCDARGRPLTQWRVELETQDVLRVKPPGWAPLKAQSV